MKKEKVVLDQFDLKQREQIGKVRRGGENGWLISTLSFLVGMGLSIGRAYSWQPA